MEFDAPSEMNTGGTYLEEPGTYHFSVTNVWEGTGPKGGVINGFCLGLSVLAGTVEGQEEKDCNLTFFMPNLQHSETAQRISRESITAALIAMNLMSPADLGKRVKVDMAQGVGSQVIATLTLDEYDGRKNLRLHFSNIYHVDDPRAKAFPKDASALNLIAQEKRRGASYFEPLLKKKAASQPASTISQAQLADL